MRGNVEEPKGPLMGAFFIGCSLRDKRGALVGRFSVFCPVWLFLSILHTVTIC